MGELHNSELRKRCERLTLAIDSIVGELVGDESYLRVKDHPAALGLSDEPSARLRTRSR